MTFGSSPLLKVPQQISLCPSLLLKKEKLQNFQKIKIALLGVFSLIFFSGDREAAAQMRIPIGAYRSLQCLGFQQCCISVAHSKSSLGLLCTSAGVYCI